MIISIKVKNIQSDFLGYRTICKIYDLCKVRLGETIELDFAEVQWFDAQMASPLGAIIERLERERWLEIKIVNLRNNIESILTKNGFMNYMNNSDVIRDTYRTTIPFGHYSLQDDKLFAEHVYINVIGHRSFPNQLKNVQEIVLHSTSEIFSNSIQHSESQIGVIVCGQLFPRKNSLDYILTDAGLGFRNNIVVRSNVRYENDHDYIKWALSDSNTSRQSTTLPGGVGLKSILDFMKTNRGELTIVSNKGYVKTIDGEVVSAFDMQHEFPGSSVHLKFYPVNI